VVFTEAEKTFDARRGAMQPVERINFLIIFFGAFVNNSRIFSDFNIEVHSIGASSINRKRYEAILIIANND